MSNQIEKDTVAEAIENELEKQTEEIAEAVLKQEATEDTDVNDQKIGKFKNPQELLRAYGELEKEFTRRSQKLKELEAAKQAGISDGQAGISNGDWKGAVDKFFKEIPSAKAFKRDIATEIVNDPDLRSDANCLNLALMRVLLNKFRTPEQLMNDGQFLDEYVLGSERVKEAIIANYLDGVRKGEPPYTLHGGGLQCVAPQIKPKTVEEAGFLFLKNNK